MSGTYSSATWPAVGFAAVTPSNTVSIPNYPRALFIGVGGDVVAVTNDGSGVVTFKNVPSGSVLPIQVSRVNATSTTATDIVALY